MLCCLFCIDGDAMKSLLGFILYIYIERDIIFLVKLLCGCSDHVLIRRPHKSDSESHSCGAEQGGQSMEAYNKQVSRGRTLLLNYIIVIYN